MASGDFVVVLDADDVVRAGADRSALRSSRLLRPDLDIVTTDAAWESNGRVVGRFNGEANPFEVENQRAAILERCFIVAPGVRRSAVLAVGGQDTAARGRRGLGLLDPDDPRRIEGRIRRRAAPASTGCEQGSVSSDTAHRRSGTASTCSSISDESSAAGRRPRGARHRALTPSAGPSRSPGRTTRPTAETGTHASWRLPLPATQAHGRKTRLKAAALAAAPSSVRPRLVDRLGLPAAPGPPQVGSSD